MEERKRGMKEAWHPLFGRYMPPFSRFCLPTSEITANFGHRFIAIIDFVP